MSATAGKMNPEYKARWLAELRSGKHEQGVQWLHEIESGRKCCLGILSDLLVEDGVLERSVQNDIYVYGPADSTSGLGVLAEEVTGVSTLGQLPDGRRLSTLNDSGRFDFNAIADIIEAEL